MRRSWFGPERTWLLACCVAGLGLSGCGGKEFASGQGSGASSSGGDGGSSGKSSGGSSASGSGGDQSLAGSGEPGGSGGTAGAGGSGSVGCACEPGEYCREASKDCLPCAELSRLRFLEPERLDTLSGSAASRFPRVGETGTDMLYSVAGAGMRYTTDFSTSAGNLVAQSTTQDSGPLLLAESVMLPEGNFNFAFGRETEMERRQLFFGQWQGDLVISGAAPAPYNGDTSDYSIAIATNPTDDGIARAYWMSDREQDRGLTLVTALLTANPQVGRVALGVGPGSCAPDDADLSPWVTADGQTLLFSNSRVDENCTPGEPKDIYTVLLQPSTGEPAAAPAVPLADVNGDSNDVDPSFSNDLCDLYFASDRDGEYALYRAHRR
jgi:hypothetical protein